MASFMMRIEAVQRSPLDQLAFDYSQRRALQPSIEFCRCAAGVPESDETIARRLSVTVTLVRGWRDIGRRASSTWSCR